MATPDETLELLLNPTWVNRRKESLELVTDEQLRHHVSVDFTIPASGGKSLPLFVLRKAPGQFARFDFTDEKGRSLPLPLRAEILKTSEEVLKAAARRVLAPHGNPLTERLERQLERIATGTSDHALAAYQYMWPHPELKPPKRRWWHRQRPDVDPESGSAENKVQLMRDPEFRWLLRTFAHSALVVIDVDPADGERRILKLAYDEEIYDLSRTRAPGFWSTLARRAGRFFYRLGWRGYPVKVFIPYAGARTFHYELHPPDGLQLVETGLRVGTSVVEQERPLRRRGSKHLYLPDATKPRSVTAFAQTRVRGAGFTGATVWAPMMVAAATAACYVGAEHVAGRSPGSAPALLLLFPGLITTFIARTEHPLVARLMKFARWALMGSALVAYVGAARLAFLDYDTTEDQLRDFFGPLAIVAAALAAVLLITWFLPLRLSHPARALVRRARRPSEPESD